VGAHQALSSIRANPEASPAIAGAHRVADLITRRRDAHGNRHPWFYSHGVPTIEDVPLLQTPLADATAAIKERLPISGAELEHEYDHKLRPALRRLIAIRDAEDKELVRHNEQAEQLSKDLDKEIEAVAEAEKQALAEVEARLVNAHRDAARQVAETGGIYDPQHPSDECALRLPAPDAAAVAAELKLPWTPSDRQAVMGVLVGWLVTVTVGMMIGLSLGIVAGYVPVGDWLSRPVGLTFLLVVGAAAAVAGKWAIKLSSREAAMRYWLSLPASNWLLFAVMGVLVTATIVAIDSFVEREGLMANVRLQDLARSLSNQAGSGPSTDREWLYFLMAIILTFGYAVNAFWEGYLSGRYDACMNRIRQAQSDRHQEADAQWRESSAVRSALHALGLVRVGLEEKRVLEARIAQRIAQLDSKRQPMLQSLPADACQRIQDAYDQFNGTQATFDAMLSEAKARCGEGSGWRSLVGGRRPRGGRAGRVNRDTTRRIH
jgi:hypothetical protein